MDLHILNHTSGQMQTGNTSHASTRSCVNLASAKSLHRWHEEIPCVLPPASHMTTQSLLHHMKAHQILNYTIHVQQHKVITRNETFTFWYCVYCASYDELVCRTNFTHTKYILYTLSVLHVLADHTCHHQRISVVIKWHVRCAKTCCRTDNTWRIYFVHVK